LGVSSQFSCLWAKWAKWAKSQRSVYVCLKKWWAGSVLQTTAWWPCEKYRWLLCHMAMYGYVIEIRRFFNNQYPGEPSKRCSIPFAKTQCSSRKQHMIPSNGQCSCTICCEFFLLQPPFLICRIHVKRTNVTLFLERILSKWFKMIVLLTNGNYMQFLFSRSHVLAKTKDHFLEQYVFAVCCCF
jgi:hypothetical protein